MALSDDVRDLGRTTILRELGEDALRLLAFAAENRIMRTGDILFRAGDVSDGGLLLLTGEVALRADGAAPRNVQAPTLLGRAALLVETVRPCTAVALTTSNVLKISRGLFHRVLREHPDSAVRLHRHFQGELRSVLQELRAIRPEVGAN